MKTAPDEALTPYIRDHKQYVPEAVEAAIAEYARRGKPLPDEQIQQIRANVAEVQENQRRMEAGSMGFAAVDTNVTTDIDAPELYSPRAIYGFTVAFGAIFGGILFCINLSRINKQSYILPVLIGAFAYTALQVVLGTYIHGSTLTIVTSILAGVIYQQGLWPRIAGPTFAFRKRSIWPPLIIGLVFLGLVFLAIYNAL